MGIKLVGPLNSGTAAGANGSATNNATTTTVIAGVVYGVYVRYNDSPPAGTTDVTIATAGNSAPALTLLTLTNAATDGWFYPRALIHDNTGTASTTIYDHVAIFDNVKVTIAQANSGDSADVWLIMDC